MHTWRAWLARSLVLVVAVVGIQYARHHLISDNAHPYNRVQRIALVNAQRVLPPKDEKPKEAPPKEPDIQKPQLSLSEPVEAAPPGEKPQNDQLGVDADGEGAADGFGLMAKRGGRDITTLGGGGAGGSGSSLSAAANRFNFGAYGGLVRQRLQNELMALAPLQEHDYVAVIWIWIDALGRIERVELPQGSGFMDVDSALRKVLGQMPLLPEPPVGLPQPLRLRVTSRDIESAKR